MCNPVYLLAGLLDRAKVWFVIPNPVSIGNKPRIKSNPEMHADTKLGEKQGDKLKLRWRQRRKISIGKGMEILVAKDSRTEGMKGQDISGNTLP